MKECERYKKQFWIDTFGKIHKLTKKEYMAVCSCSVHSCIAQKLYPEANFPQDILVNLNWIKVVCKIHGNRIKYKPNQAQINAMDKLGYRAISSATEGIIEI